jgi:hypothetical protein
VDGGTTPALARGRHAGIRLALVLARASRSHQASAPVGWKDLEATMKTIALMLVRNEDWILRTTLPQLRRFVDEIIALDGHSEDRTPALIQESGGIVISQDSDYVNYSRWRQTLLEKARERGGTHLVWLDADEAFTSNFLATFRQRLAAMRPGDKLGLDWLCLWKDPRQMRNDDSIWSHLIKDFVFCDDGRSAFSAADLHEGRTPGPNRPATIVRIPRPQGAVLHFQFVPFEHFQMKQAFLRCLEWIMQKGRAWQINEKYAATLDDPSARCVPLPPEWIEGLRGLDDLRAIGSRFYGRLVATYFEQHGPAFFEPLQIWHIPELREAFRQAVGREPHVPPPPGRFERLAVRLQRKIRSVLQPLTRRRPGR